MSDEDPPIDSDAGQEEAPVLDEAPEEPAPSGSGSKPGSKPASRPASEPAINLAETLPISAEAPGSKPGSRPGSKPGSKPGSEHEISGGSKPGSRPASRTGSTKGISKTASFEGLPEEEGEGEEGEGGATSAHSSKAVSRVQSRVHFEQVPLGQATSKALLECDQKPFILEKPFHEGTMGRLGIADGTDKKAASGGSSDYEDYHWQLERDFREVPPDMSVGFVSAKAESLMYEEEHFILGKHDRTLHEEIGYAPTAGKHESLLELNKPIGPINLQKLPKEPVPCRLPYIPEDDACGSYEPPPRVDDGSYDYQPPPPPQAPTCFNQVTSRTGQVYNFTYEAVTCVSVGPCATGEQDGTCPAGADGPQAGGGGGAAACGGGCPNKLKCESNIQAVCNAARNAMAICDTLLGSDNFPCNVGDRPELELANAEDGVWSWLYQLILKVVPIDYDENSNMTNPPFPGKCP